MFCIIYHHQLYRESLLPKCNCWYKLQVKAVKMIIDSTVLAVAVSKKKNDNNHRVRNCKVSYVEIQWL